MPPDNLTSVTVNAEGKWHDEPRCCHRCCHRCQRGHRGGGSAEAPRPRTDRHHRHERRPVSFYVEWTVESPLRGIDLDRACNETDGRLHAAERNGVTDLALGYAATGYVNVTGYASDDDLRRAVASFVLACHEAAAPLGEFVEVGVLADRQPRRQVSVAEMGGAFEGGPDSVEWLRGQRESDS
jgi:hypothetical protein